MAAPEPSPQPAGGVLGGRFVVERTLGSGGMGEVLLATDTVLRRRVALKRVAARWRDDAQHRRQLMREAERCSSLTHPNIAAIYDIVQDDKRGELVIVMEYVDGVTLRPSIGHPFDRETFFRIALPCAEAMAAAHHLGIVHGDLKPENVMLARNTAREQATFASSGPEVFADSGIVKVLDFGLSTCLKAGPEELTQSYDSFDRDIRGTLGYIAPEVLRGHAPAPAADVFALGVIFYELLTGKHPFIGATAAITLDRTLHTEPDLPASQGAGHQVATTVRKMLAKDPAARYRDAAEVRNQLQLALNSQAKPSRLARAYPWVAGIAVAAFIAGAVAHYTGRHNTIANYKLIAVLPFRPINGQANLQALGDGLTEIASAKLARIAEAEGLQLVAPGDLRKLRSTDESEALDKARHELGAELAFVPSMEQSGNRVRINFRLVDTGSRREIDGDSVVAPADDVFALEDSAVERMAALLDVKVRAQDRAQLAEHGTLNRDAYENYVKGIGYLREYDDPANAGRAVAAFQSALSADPNYGLADAGLGQALWQQYLVTRQASYVDEARQMCGRAEELAARAAPPHVCLGTVALGTGKYEDAVREFGLATSINSADDDAVSGLAQAQKLLNRPQEAEATFKQAIALRPQYWAGYSRLAGFYTEQGRYRDAAEQFTLATQHAPQNSIVFSGLGGAYIFLGQYDKAEQALRRSIELSPRYQAYSNLGFVYLRERRFEDAISAFEHAMSLGAQDYKIWGHLADAYYWAPGKRALAQPRFEKAIALAQQALKVNPNDYGAEMLLAHYYAVLGKRAQADLHIRRAMAAQQQDQEVFYYAALVSNELGDISGAVRWLRAALAHGYSPAEVKRDVQFDNLRGNPDVQKMLAAN